MILPLYTFNIIVIYRYPNIIFSRTATFVSFGPFVFLTVYVDGHCAACRYGFMMRLGSVILKVESRQVAEEMWYFPLLKPYHDHVPVKADLSDLEEKIRWCRENDDKCREIGQNAKIFYEKYVAKSALLDYVEMCWKILQHKKPDDFVIATGRQTSVRDFVYLCAEQLGWGGISWEGDGIDEVGRRKDNNDIVIRIDPIYYRPTEVNSLLGNSLKATDILGWSPKITVEKLVEEMILADLELV